jgi:large subunit ribosomal protein L10
MAASEWKKQRVKELAKLLKEYPVIGVLNLRAMPCSSLQQMRKKFRPGSIMAGGRKRLFLRAIEMVEKDKPGLKNLEKYLDEGLPGLLFTKDNPFILFKTLNQSKILAPAKAGDIAPKDLVIQAGPTPFAPGPIIGELGRIGLKTGVEAGKVTIKLESTVAKKGQTISGELASILMRLGITPMEIGLDLIAAYEKGTIFGKDVLAIDEVEFMGRLETAVRHGINLAVNTGIMTKDTTPIMIAKAFNEAKALAIAQNIFADAVVGDILAKANCQASALKEQANL